MYVAQKAQQKAQKKNQHQPTPVAKAISIPIQETAPATVGNSTEETNESSQASDS
jgi:hypothetical protein